MSMFATRKKRVVAVAAVLAIAAVGGGIAFAYWTSTGTGTGSATTGTSTNFVVTSTAPTGGPLTPGGPTETIAITVNNPGTGSENLSSVVASVAKADGTAWTAVTGCSAADYSVGTTTGFTYGTLAAGASVTGSVAITMNNLGTNQDGCKNAAVPLYIVAS
jgi:hypothetical protein